MLRKPKKKKKASHPQLMEAGTEKEQTEENG